MLTNYLQKGDVVNSYLKSFIESNTMYHHSVVKEGIMKSQKDKDSVFKEIVVCSGSALLDDVTHNNEKRAYNLF